MSDKKNIPTFYAIFNANNEIVLETIAKNRLDSWLSYENKKHISKELAKKKHGITCKKIVIECA